MVRVADVICGGSKQCRSCADKTKFKDTSINRAHLARISLLGAEKARGYKIAAQSCVPSNARYIRQAGTAAKRRCEDPKMAQYNGYGGRGIQFKFDSAVTYAWWVLENLGHRPTPQHTLDRIDNNGHYEAGNLRWATKSEQNRNKRAYLGPKYGHRMQALAVQKPEYTYEGLRKFILLGWTDAQILVSKKPKGGRPRKVKNDSSSI